MASKHGIFLSVMDKLFLIFLLTLFILVLAGAGCASAPRRAAAPALPPPPPSQIVQPMASQKITLTTSDGVSIVGEYNKPVAAKRAVLMLHMMPATKESWQPLSGLLNKKDIATLAIDLRGHGESTVGSGGKKLNYKNFNDREHQASSLDIAASLEFLQKESFGLADTVVAGASIGANLAIQALEQYPQIKKAAALSPGLDYRGVLAAPAIKKLSGSQRLMLVAAEDDSYSADTARALAKESSAPVTLKVYPSGGHGTNLWDTQPSFLPELAEWIIE